MHDPNADARHQISDGVVSDGVMREPWQDGNNLQHEAFYPGTRTPGGKHAQAISYRASDKHGWVKRSKAKNIILWLTDIVTLPSPKVTETSFLASARGDPAVLRPGHQREQAAWSEAGHFAQRCPSEITVEDYWEHSEVSFCLCLNTVCLFNVPRWPVFMCAKSVNKVTWQKRKEALLQENLNKLKQWMKKTYLISISKKPHYYKETTWVIVSVCMY